MPYKDRQKQLEYMRNYSKNYKGKPYSEFSDKQKTMHKKRTKKYTDKNPWLSSYYGAKDRCNNPNNKDYKNYGKRGIKFLLTKEGIKRLWFRDKAWLLNQPSIDRKDNDGDYIFSNCQFIELEENARKNRINFTNKYIWIINYIKNHSFGTIDTLNQDFVSLYIKKFNLSYQEGLTGFDVCPDLTKQLRDMYNKNILQRAIMGLGLKKPGLPKWIRIYQLYN